MKSRWKELEARYVGKVGRLTCEPLVGARVKVLRRSQRTGDLTVEILEAARSAYSPGDTVQVKPHEFVEEPTSYKPNFMTTDAKRLDWLELKHTLHTEVEITYVVDGYEVEIVEDTGRSLSESYHGKTLREAIDLAMIEVKSWAP